MAYVLGFFAADGNIVVSKRGAFYFSAYSADKVILLAILKVLQANHKISKRESDTGVVYRFQIGSKEIVNDLFSLGLTPNKATRMEIPKVPKRFIGDFVRGYFDGDGNVWMGFVNRKRKKPTPVLQVAFTSGSRNFLFGIKNSLGFLGIKGGSIFYVKNKNCSRVLFSTLDSLKIYRIMYNVPNPLYLGRKKRIFEKFLKARNAVVV